MVRSVHLRQPQNARATRTLAYAHHAPPLSRRAFVALTVGLGVGSANVALAEQPASSPGEPVPAVAFPVQPVAPAPQPTDPTIFQYDFASDVPCNLRAKEYWSIIVQQRPRIWQQIAQQIQASDYSTLSISLNMAPMADLRQAALYLPWALLQNSEYTASTDAFKAYKNFDDHVKDLKRAAQAAAAAAAPQVAVVADPAAPASEAPPPVAPAAGVPDVALQAQRAQQVQQAFILMSASLDGFLAVIPPRYFGATLFQAQAP